MSTTAPNRKQTGLMLPLAFHTSGLSWPSNITSALGVIITPRWLLNPYRQLFCGIGSFFCQNTSTCCPDLNRPTRADINRLFGNQTFCTDSNPATRIATMQITGIRSSSSVAPWVISINYDPNRYPSEIWEAKCACSGSCNLFVGNLDYRHQPIYSKMVVGVRDRNGSSFFEVRQFAIGCTCAVE